MPKTGMDFIPGRFRNQLIGKCSRAQTTYDDFSISPVIRQSLMHWGYELNPKDAEAYIKKKSDLRRLKVSASPDVDFATVAMPSAAGGGGSKVKATAKGAAKGKAKANATAPTSKPASADNESKQGSKRDRSTAKDTGARKRAKVQQKGSSKKKK